MDRLVPSSRPAGRALLAVGIGLWLLASLWTWPAVLSFADEVGYVGQARIFLDGRVRPTAEDPGIWHLMPERGLIAKYPLLYPALLTPFIGVAPRSAFAIGIATAVFLVIIAARVLRSWNQDPLWSLLLLAHPAIVVLSRTLMADLLLSTFVVGAYYALSRQRLWSAAALVAATVAIKPTGWFIAGLLLGGEALTHARDLLARRSAALRRMMAAGAGFAAGMAVVIALNYAANGSPRFGYHQHFGPPDFGIHFLLTTGWAHAKSLLLLPPLLIVGVWPYWRRRDFGPLAVIAGLVALMSIYFFVDWGRNRLDSLVLSQRLILPAVAFLMIGYFSLLAEAVRRLPSLLGAWVASPLRLVPLALVALPLLFGYQIGARHRRWQQAMKDAVDALTHVTSERGVTEVGVTANALKYGLMFPGRAVLYPEAAARKPEVILCATKNTSYRIHETDYDCGFAGYRKAAASVPGSDILIRGDLPGGAPRPDEEQKSAR